jgi:cell division protease FtsH
VRDIGDPPTPSRGSPVPSAGRNRPRGEAGGLEPQPSA